MEREFRPLTNIYIYCYKSIYIKDSEPIARGGGKEHRILWGEAVKEYIFKTEVLI